MNDHIVMVRNTHTLKCLHCGVTYEMAMPCPAEIFVAILDAFIESHKDCEAPDEH